MKVNEKSVSLASTKETKAGSSRANTSVPSSARGIFEGVSNFKLFKPVNNSVANRTILQYPHNRLNFYEQLAYDSMLDSMYKDNTIFTAYDFNGEKRDREGLKGLLNTVVGGKDNYGMNKSMLANIMMPRSNTDIDQHKHEFITSEESLMSRGNGSVGNAIGSGVATMVAGVFDNISKGYFADYGEALGTPTRATYKGADHRTKTYSWKLTPRNAKDLDALMSIIKTFKILSYGMSHQSGKVGEFTDYLNKNAQSLFDQFRGDESEITTYTEQVIDSFRYVKVMSNPTLWFIRNYNHRSVGAMDTSIFGPANIVDVKVNSTPDGSYQGFAKYPNFSSTYEIEITFREAISHTRDTIVGVL